MVRLSAFLLPAMALLATVKGHDHGHGHPTKTSLALPSSTPWKNPNPPGPLVVPPPPPPDKIFSYSQPPLPEQTAARDPANWKLNKNLHHRKTRLYDFRLSYAAGAPSGFQRRLTTANAQFPGPLIEANVGDWIEVKVTNDLDEPQALHWHGRVTNGCQC